MDGVRAICVDEDEEVIFFTDRETGLRGITVLDGSGPGPYVGACRSRPYDDEQLAIADALRQARTTTAKAAIAGLPLKGACTVMLGDGSADGRGGSPMPAIGRAVGELGGRHVLLPDLQGDLRDMDEAASGTSHVLGRCCEMEIDAIEATAIGLQSGIESAVRRTFGRDKLMGVRIGIVGLGSVGFSLAERLRLEGARLTVSDRDPRRTERAVRALGINCVTTEEIIHLDLDVLVPTAAKDTIDEDMLSHLRCRIVAGAVDDPLRSPGLGQALHDQSIVYAPDTVINAGGMIALVQPLLPSGGERLPLPLQLQAIGTRIDRLIERSDREHLSTSAVAQRMAEEALAERQTARSAELLAS